MAENGSLSRKQERFLQALLLGESIAGAARATGIGERTAYNWLSNPAMQAEKARRESVLREAEEREIERIMTTGYAATHERVKALDRIAREAEKPYTDPDTGKVYQLWNSPDHLREWRGLLDDIAKEVGERVKKTKQEVSGGLDVTGARDDLFNKLKAFASKHDAPQS